jgi:hypothetical protein
MATSIEVRHTINCSVDDFWSNLFFDPDFNRKLYIDRLKFKNWEVQDDQVEQGGVRVRKIRSEPDMELPGALKKVVGESMQYVEHGKFDPASKRYRFHIEPSKMADKIKSAGELWVESKGDKQCERIVKMEIEVKIFGIGKMAEGFIEKQTRHSYDVAARFSNEWIAEKGL